MFALIDWFIPPALRAGSPDNLRRARLIIVFCLGMLINTIPNVVILLSHGVVSVGILVLLPGVSFIATPFLLRASGSLRLSAHFLVTVALTCSVVGTSFSGGLESPGMVWWGPYLIFTVMLLGTRMGLFWTVVVAIECIVFLVLQKNGVTIRNDTVNLDRSEALMSSYLTAFIAFFLLIRVYENLKTRMLAEIDGARRLIESAHASARMVLDNVSQGLVLADATGRLAGERSQSLIRWFGPVLPGETLLSYFGRANPQFAAWLEVSWSSIFEDVLPIDLVLDQLPARFGHHMRHYSVTYRPIGARPAIGSVLVVITDITILLAAEQAKEEQREMLSIFQRIASDRGIVMEFVEESRSRVQVLANPELGRVVELREIHTLKGNTGLFGLIRSSRFFNDLEDLLLQENRGMNDEDRERLADHWRQVEAKVMPLLGESTKIQLSRPEYEDALMAVANGESYPLLQARMKGWVYEPTINRFSIFAQQLIGIADRMGIKGVTVRINDGGLRLPRDQLATFWANFSHVIRNAIDHGLETKEERHALGKPEGGLVELSSRLEKGEIVIEISDDGRGVDWTAVAEKAKARGLPANSRGDLEAALFADGVSTKQEVSDLSGRGVGLSAVRAIVLAMGGRIHVESSPGRGSRFSFYLKTWAVEGPPRDTGPIR